MRPVFGTNSRLKSDYKSASLQSKIINILRKKCFVVPTSRKMKLIFAFTCALLQENQLEVRGAITLISDNGLHFLVDTGAASETEVLLRGLADASIALDDIDAVILTHAHPGHAGNLNFFGSKPILFHVNEHVGRHVATTELSERPYRKLTANVEVWKTPGHTPRDLSVLVHNVHSEEGL